MMMMRVVVLKMRMLVIEIVVHDSTSVGTRREVMLLLLCNGREMIGSRHSFSQLNPSSFKLSL